MLQPAQYLTAVGEPCATNYAKPTGDSDVVVESTRATHAKPRAYAQHAGLEPTATAQSGGITETTRAKCG